MPAIHHRCSCGTESCGSSTSLRTRHSGSFPLSSYTVHDLDVRPGDRLLLLSDGILDGRPRKGAEDFGIPRVAEVLTSAPALPATELVRLLTTRVLDYCDGKLPDDATAVCLDWFGPVGERRQP